MLILTIIKVNYCTRSIDMVLYSTPIANTTCTLAKLARLIIIYYDLSSTQIANLNQPADLQLHCALITYQVAKLKDTGGKFISFISSKGGIRVIT